MFCTQILIIDQNKYTATPLYGSQIFFQYTVCENVSRRLLYTQMQAVKILLPVYFLAKFESSYLPRGGVNGSFDIQCLRNRGSCVIERRLSNFCLQIKTASARGKRDNDD